MAHNLALVDTETTTLGRFSTLEDVKSLFKVYGVPKVNSIITYGAIEAIIRCKKQSNRFNTIVSAWRAFLYDAHNVLLCNIRNNGYQVQNEDGRIAFAAKKYNSGIKQVSKSLDIIKKTDKSKITPDNKLFCDHVEKVEDAFIRATNKVAKKLGYQAIRL